MRRWVPGSTRSRKAVAFAIAPNELRREVARAASRPGSWTSIVGIFTILFGWECPFVPGGDDTRKQASQQQWQHKRYRSYSPEPRRDAQMDSAVRFRRIQR